MSDFINSYSQAVLTSFGFFWKALWAFILGYLISAMIQVFVSKPRLTHHMGKDNIKSVGLSTFFGSVSSSCSFAALSAARSLFQKGAHFVSVVAFMFASTNLVIELGILILIFLGWQFLAAEIIGGLLLIIISSILIKFTYPKKWIKDSRQKLEEENEEQENFDWKKRIKSARGWHMVAHRFVMEWKMVWQEILIGFTIAGFMAVFIPKDVWAKIFFVDYATGNSFVIVLENALVAPFIAAATFIGSMGNIPLATVLSANGVVFAGIMGFIYSDLMVPPLVRINAKYYGWKLALYIAGIMYASIVFTAIILHYIFAYFNFLPQSQKVVEEVVQFKFDYSFWLNLVFIILAAGLIFLSSKYKTEKEHKMQSQKKIIGFKGYLVRGFILILAFGLVLALLS